MKKVVVAGAIPKAGLEILQEADLDIDVFTGKQLISEQELIKRVVDADAILSLLSTPVTRKVIDAAKKVKVIANYGAGYNNIDCDYAEEKSIYVTNTPHASTAATADLTMALILASARRVAEGDQLCRTTGFNGWSPLFFLGREVTGKTLGIVGLGNIGQAVAKRAAGFEMEVLYYSPQRKGMEVETACKATYVPLEELLQRSDFVALNCSYNPSMIHMIAEPQFKMMKPTAYLINASRGPIVEEAALVKALIDKQIEGAALDVFEFEPQIGEALKQLPNVVLTPHIGNATFEARDQMARIAASNIVRTLTGEKPLYIVNHLE